MVILTFFKFIGISSFCLFDKLRVDLKPNIFSFKSPKDFSGPLKPLCLFSYWPLYGFYPRLEQDTENKRVSNESI